MIVRLQYYCDFETHYIYLRMYPMTSGSNDLVYSELYFKISESNFFFYYLSLFSFSMRVMFLFFLLFVSSLSVNWESHTGTELGEEWPIAVKCKYITELLLKVRNNWSYEIVVLQFDVCIYYTEVNWDHRKRKSTVIYVFSFLTVQVISVC